ncbi:MAG: hypothetical protein Q7W29_04995 [bacterium]|nr:hypothetical protein [bacterium]
MNDTIADAAAPTLELLRDARLFVRRAGALARLESERTARIRLTADQIHHPDAPGDVVVRHGRLRLSEFLGDGREVCRAVLQAGFCFTIHGPAAARTGTPLDVCVLMALGDAELWRLPPGTFARLDATTDHLAEEYR